MDRKARSVEALMLGWPRPQHRCRERLLTREQAAALIEDETRLRGWDGFNRRFYRLEWRGARPLWICQGVYGFSGGGSMIIEVDALTGVLVSAVVGR
jgi:hypothetical protein